MSTNTPTPTDDPFLPVHTRAALEPGEEPLKQEPIHKIRSALRGRWPWALGLGAGLALLGAGIGFFTGSAGLTYTSTGIIELKRNPEYLIWKDQTQDQFGDFEVRANTYVSKMESARIIQHALNDPELANVAFPAGVDRAEYIKSGLDAVRSQRDDLIYLNFTDTSPARAAAIAKALMNAFAELEIHGSTQENVARQKLVENQLIDSGKRLEKLKADLSAIHIKYGTTNLDRLLESLSTQGRGIQQELTFLRGRLSQFGLDVVALEAEIDAQIERNKLNATTADTTETAPDAAAPEEPFGVDALTDEELNSIAEQDGAFKEYLVQKDRLDQALETASVDVGPKHREYLKLQSQINENNQKMNDRIEELRKQGGFFDNIAYQRSPSQLKLEFIETKKQLDRHITQSEALAADEFLASELEVKINDENALHDKIDNRYKQLTTETGAVEAITIYNTPELRQIPSDASLKKRKMLLAGGFLFGGALGFGGVLLLGLLNPKLRDSQDLRDLMLGPPVLGVLPQLPASGGAAVSAIHSYTVHHIRTLLQIGPGMQGRRVITVTGAAPGDGKTSLTASLALSFAASGSKTLVIDADLASGGLSQKLNAAAHRRLGQILVREGHITPQQLEQALHLSRESKRQIGATLIDLGFLSKENLDWSLIQQSKSDIGLLDALSGEPLELCVTEVGVENLSVLPIGGAGPEHVAKLSPGMIRRLLDQARAHYDAVLIDTGSVLGSLEASHLSAESDGVIVVAARDGLRDVVRHAVAHLNGIGAQVVGVVFNRADGFEVESLERRTLTSRPKPPADPGSGSGRKPIRQAPSGTSATISPALARVIRKET